MSHDATPAQSATTHCRAFLGDGDTSGFSLLIKQGLFRDWLDLRHLERYRHRISLDGRAIRGPR